jgi:hypothetical protein
VRTAEGESLELDSIVAHHHETCPNYLIVGGICNCGHKEAADQLQSLYRKIRQDGDRLAEIEGQSKIGRHIYHHNDNAPVIFAKVEKNSKGYNFEASVGGCSTVEEALTLLATAMARLESIYGQVSP